METRKSDYAFPVSNKIFAADAGLSKLEYFAAAALTGLLAGNRTTITQAPELSVAIATGLIKELNVDQEDETS
jgi:hypothetical protein